MRAGRAGVIIRALVLSSMLLAAATGVWLVSAQGPAAAALAGGAFLLGAAGGRLAPRAAAWAVLALGGIQYGVLRLMLGPALAGLPIWLAAFAGLVAGVSSRGSWQSRWRVPLAWWAASVAVSWPIILLREMDFALDGPRGTTPLIIPSALIQMSVALWMDWVIGSGNRRTGNREPGTGPVSGLPVAVPGLLAALLAGAIISALAAIYQRFVDPAWLSGPPWSEMGRSVGMMGDANPLGVLMASLAPLAFILIGRSGSTFGSSPDRDPAARSSSAIRMALASGVAGLLWAAAWFSGARSMLIITAAGLAGLLLEWLRTRLGMVRAAVAGGLLLVAALVAIVLIAPRAQPGTPLERLFRYLPKTSAADGAYELFWRRDGYGLAAIQAFRESPLNGVGIGTFSTWSPAYFREAGGGYTIAPDNAQNLWRQVLAERGMLGLLPILWLTGLTMAALLRGGPIVLRAVLTGIGVTLLFGFPVQDATIAAAIGLLVAWAAVEGATAPPREESTRAGEAGFVAVLAVSIVAAGIDVAAARGEMRLPARAARFGLPYSQGFGEQEKAPGDVTARAFRGHASLVRPAATNRFELRGWVRSPDGEARVRIWNAGMLIFNISIPDGGTFAQTIPVPPGGRSVWLDFHTSRGNVLVAGTFEGAIAP